AGIETFSTQPSPEQNEWTEKAKALIGSTGSDISAYVAPQGKTIERVKTSGRLTAQNPLPFFQTETPGRVVGIRLSPASALAGKERAIVLRAYWDGDSLPAILAPAGDFFGYAWGEPAAQSLLFGTEGDTNYCYFPMPFDQSARIELVLEGESNSVVPIEAEVLFCPESRQANEGKFYSLWRRENPTTAGKPFTFIETQGRGHLVGVTQQAQGLETGQTPFFEGDDQTTIDGELVIHGTGSEDFYNGGWYDVPGRWETRRSFPFSGCLGYKKYLGRTGAYRIFLGDAYAYRHSLLQTIEHAPTNNDILNDYCGMVYLYSEARPTGAFTLPAVANRAVVDPTRIVFAASWNVPIYSFSLQNAQLSKQVENIGDHSVRYFSMKAKDKAVFGDHSIGFICEIPAVGQYKISLDTVKSPSGAKIQLFLDEVAIGPEVDLYRAEKQRASDDYVGTMKLEEGPNVLMFKLVGKNDASSGLDFDLCNIICEKME
ncbi:MAG: DUF2961 domain-containing protein, partial [bacterium]|nr:DUF2961 domain-containing protein [bacterium]